LRELVLIDGKEFKDDNKSIKKINGGVMEKEKSKKYNGISWWLWIIIVLAAVVVTYKLMPSFSTKSSNAAIVKTTPDTAEEIRTKQYLSSLRGDIVRYFEEKGTYAGWTPNQAAIDQVKKAGSELKTQALTKTSYVIYAKMPSSKLTFCMDANNFTGEVKTLSSSQKTCK
jgi:hypothetical protein